jgi:exodeoxyribonuclease VII large subunit
VELYAPGGSYAIIVEDLIPDGVGALALRFEQLKKQLTEEGLFNDAHKQSLPVFSRKIGVVTSPSGAVIRDIITTVQRRFPMTEIVLYPTKVQGDGAAEEIAENIRLLNERADIDLLIVGRGGGSMEDLWCFNEEIVVRAIFESRLPVISSVGHETDVTLADFAADHRAATPTAAAELATPNTKLDLISWLTDTQQRLTGRLSVLIKNRREQVEKLSNSAVFRQPARLYDGHLQKVDRLTERLTGLTEEKLGTNQHRYALAVAKIVPAYGKIVEYNENRVERLYQSLLLLDISKIKARGFALVTDSKGQIIKSVKNVKTGDALDIALSDGTIKAEVKEK